ncbi:MAG: hypothetical protein RLZZ557_833 [Bacteroidota bacterium]
MQHLNPQNDNMKTQSIKIIVEQTNDGFSAYAENLNIFSTGNDLTELKKNIAEAVDLYFEELGFSFEKYNLEFAYEAPQIA